jgi:DNA (cytosine-5)-methyltransferase 1
MNCGHLFNGIGGFALAAHWMGWANVMHCEIDPFCNKVMNKHFPNSYQHEDIRTTDFTIWRGKLNLITGGFPCQPYSTAGKRKGKEDGRHLWPEMLRAIREIQPQWIVGENVRGLTNWNGGLVFDEVQADLETEGYEVLPFLLPAAGVNAPHRRDRIWFIAHTDSRGFSGNNGAEQDKCKKETNEGTEQREERNEVQWERVRDDSLRNDAEGVITNPDIEHRTTMGVYQERRETAKLEFVRSNAWDFRNTWEVFPTQPPIRNGNDGLPSRLVGITVRKWTEQGLKALGNAVVPQVVYQIFKAIEQWQLSHP